MLVELDETGERAPRVQFVACDVVRWHRVEADISAAPTLDSVIEIIEQQIEAATADAAVKHHVMRTVLTGRTPLHRQLTAAALTEVEQALVERWSNRPWSLESLRSCTAAPFDVQRLVASGGLPGEIAKYMARPMSAEAREKVWRDAGLGPLQGQLEAAKIGLGAPNEALLEQALTRALELVTTEDAA